MNQENKEMLQALSKDQLIYLIDQFDRSMRKIGEVCVEESKCHIDNSVAVDKIRDNIFDMPSHRGEDLKAYIDMKMGKISIGKYRKLIGLD